MIQQSLMSKKLIVASQKNCLDRNKNYRYHKNFGWTFNLEERYKSMFM